VNDPSRREFLGVGGLALVGFGLGPAAPWDSGFLVHPGDHFDVVLTVPGVYDYFCMPHEAAGMVGRIVVGKPLGPGAEPFDYWAGRPGTERWRRVPAAARATLPSIPRILAERRVPAVG
jgi:plastocyanin